MLETQQANFQGLPFTSKAGRACWKSPDLTLRADVLVGIAQLASGRFAASILYPDNLLKGLSALAERTVAPGITFTPDQLVELDRCAPAPGWLQPHLDAGLLAAFGRSDEPRPRAARASRKAVLAPEVDGLRGGSLLWPLLRAISDDPSWISWRSDPPSAAALLEAPQTYAGHVAVGLQQIDRDPDRFGVPEQRRTDVTRILRGFAQRRETWLNRAALDDDDRAVLAALG